MQGETFRGRVARLIQRSRKALRLYSSIGRTPFDQDRLDQGGREQSRELSELQLGQWKEINAELARELTAALERPNQRGLPAEVAALRDRFYGEWRMAEAELHEQQRGLIAAAEHGDFIRATHLGQRLVVLKARVQATQAAHHELSDLSDKSKLGSSTVEFTREIRTTDESRNDVAQNALIQEVERVTVVKASDASEPHDHSVDSRTKVIPLRRFQVS